MATAYRAGFLRDTATDVIQVTTNATGATYQGGFLRAPTGELVVTTSPSAPSTQGGFLRDANGALVVNNGGSGTVSGGWLRDAAGAIIVGSGAATQSGGFGRDTSGRLVVAGLSTFAPTDLAGLLAWWKADSLALANAAPVTSWADSSGNARTAAQATAANQPVFATAAVNGLPAVTFDGVDDALVTGAFASPTAGATVVVAQNLNRAGAGYKTVITHAAAATWVAPFARVDMRVQSPAAGEAWYGGVQDQSTAPNAVVEGSLPSTGWQVMAFVYDQTNMLLYRNGTQVAVKGRTGAMTSSTFPVYLGNDTSLTDSYQGSIAEIVYYDRGLNATELGQVHSYLQAKFAL